MPVLVPDFSLGFESALVLEGAPSKAVLLDTAVEVDELDEVVVEVDRPEVEGRTLVAVDSGAVIMSVSIISILQGR